MKGRNSIIGISLFMTAISAAPASADQTWASFDFDNNQPKLMVGQTLPFVLSDHGFKAEFNAPKGGYTVQNSSSTGVAGGNLSENYLWPSAGTDVVEIHFDRLIRSATFTYVTLDMHPMTTDVFASAYLSTDGAEPVAAAVGNGKYLAGETYPAGDLTISMTHRPFDVVRISVAAGAQGVLIDNVNVAEAPCQADFDGDGGLTPVVSIQDIFAFLDTWFDREMRADFNHDGTQDVADIFDFLTAWFEGC